MRIASTNGQTAGFLHNEIAPVLHKGDRVLYLGDWDFAGGHIEENTRKVLESVVGGDDIFASLLPDVFGGVLEWERLALTEEQVARYDLTVIMKRDGRTGREHQSVETEALSQTIIVDIVRARLDELLPEPLASVHEREEAQQEEVRRLLEI